MARNLFVPDQVHVHKHRIWTKHAESCQVLEARLAPALFHCDREANVEANMAVEDHAGIVGHRFSRAQETVRRGALAIKRNMTVTNAFNILIAKQLATQDCAAALGVRRHTRGKAGAQEPGDGGHRLGIVPQIGVGEQAADASGSGSGGDCVRIEGATGFNERRDAVAQHFDGCKERRGRLVLGLQDRLPIGVVGHMSPLLVSPRK